MKNIYFIYAIVVRTILFVIFSLITLQGVKEGHFYTIIISFSMLIILIVDIIRDARSIKCG